MARPLRRDLPDGVFHVVSRGVDGCFVFRDDDDRRLFLSLLATAVRRHRLAVHALCLMGTHYHLVVEGRVADLSRALHLLNGVYALEFNARHGRFGHLFADRFSTRAVQSEEHLAEACRYVVSNPVRAGLVRRAGDWPWSASRYGVDESAERLEPGPLALAPAPAATAAVPRPARAPRRWRPARLSRPACGRRTSRLRPRRRPPAPSAAAARGARPPPRRGRGSAPRPAARG